MSDIPRKLRYPFEKQTGIYAIRTTYRPSGAHTGILRRAGAFALLLLMPTPQGLTDATWHMAGVAAWMVAWWIAEAVPLAATALLPVVLFPVLGIMTIKDTLVPYANPVVFLFLGAFIIAAAIQKTGLHLRLGLRIVRTCGTRPDRLIAGFMTATAFLSLWLSTAVAAAMMLPTALSVIDLLRPSMEKISKKSAHNFATALLLGLTYGASIGGMGTLIGAPSNAFVKGLFSNNYGIEISFLDWMKIGVPLVVILTFSMWVILVKIVFRFDNAKSRALGKLIKTEIARQGKFSRAEKIVAFVCALTAAGWMAQGWLAAHFPGTSETGIALLGVLLLFLVPVDFGHNRYVLSWEDAEQIPWGVLLLIGGGLSMAGGLETTGLAQWIGNGFTGIGAHVPHKLLLALIVVAVAITAEFMSSIAVVTLFIPVIAPIAIGVGENPLFFVIPATLAASCSFLSPISTAGNALILATSKVRWRDMLRGGLVLEITAILFLVAFVTALLFWALQVQQGIVPDWAGASLHVPEGE